MAIAGRRVIGRGIVVEEMNGFIQVRFVS